MKNVTLTQLETAMLKEIQMSECDGIGMGYSEFDGEGFTPEQKGVLSSLIQKGIVYDSTDGSDDYPHKMYCSTENAPIQV